MGDYRFTRRAAADLEAIADFSIAKFGLDQARRYRDELRKCIGTLAESPQLGRRAEHLAHGLRRFEHGSHIIFYRPDDQDILIVRVLHHRMDVARRF